jgi:hypothetical protein
MGAIEERDGCYAMRKLICERTMFKLLVERTGILFSITTKGRAYFFFASTSYVGMKVAPTTDPYPGIVEVCGYDIPLIVRNWNKLANVKLRSRTKLSALNIYAKIAV